MRIGNCWNATTNVIPVLQIFAIPVLQEKDVGPMNIYMYKVVIFVLHGWNHKCILFHVDIRPWYIARNFSELEDRDTNDHKHAEAHASMYKLKLCFSSCWTWEKKKINLQCVFLAKGVQPHLPTMTDITTKTLPSQCKPQDQHYPHRKGTESSMAQKKPKTLWNRHQQQTEVCTAIKWLTVNWRSELMSDKWSDTLPSENSQIQLKLHGVK